MQKMFLKKKVKIVPQPRVARIKQISTGLRKGKNAASSDTAFIESR